MKSKPTKSAFKCGAAAVEYTPAPGLTLLGQMHERIATRKRDPLTANAVAFRQGRETVVLVAVDICMLDDAFVRQTQQLFAKRTGLSAGQLLLHATHSHVAPTVFDLLTAKADRRFVVRVQRAILEAAVRAVRNLDSVTVFSGTGQMDHMGWNRRAMFRDGSSRMYSDSETPGFIGLEGPRDPALPVLFARNASGAIKVVVVNFATHPNCLENERYYSADLPGEVRRQLKALLGPEVVVVYLTGAGANVAPSILDPLEADQPWRGETGVQRSGLYLAGEAAKVIAAATRPMQAPVLRVMQTKLQIPIRPWPKAGAVNDPFPWLQQRPATRRYYDAAKAEWPERTAKHNPVPVMVNVIRVGDTAFCANPSEFFVEHGLSIRKLSPARVTFISELTDGYCGYVPTKKAFARGGYETWPAPTSQLAPEAGPKIIDGTRQLLRKAFQSK